MSLWFINYQEPYYLYVPQYLQDKLFKGFFSLQFLHIHSSPILCTIGISFLNSLEPTPNGLYSPQPLQYEFDIEFLSLHFGQIHIEPELELNEPASE